MFKLSNISTLLSKTDMYSKGSTVQDRGVFNCLHCTVAQTVSVNIITYVNYLYTHQFELNVNPGILKCMKFLEKNDPL